MQCYPSIFSLETILGCNLACPECAVGGKRINRKYGMMQFKDFIRIIDKIKIHCKYLYLHLWGEPLLNPDIFMMIKYASKFTKTNISTNANTLTKESAKDLVNSGVTDIIVSIDGMSQECYATYRRGGDVNHALAALSWLAKYAGYAPQGALSHTLARIIPQFIVFKHNEHEMEEFRRYCVGLGLTASFKAPYLHSTSTFSLSTLPKYHRTIFSSSLETRKHNMMQCKDLTDVCTILLNGDIVACCYDENGKTVHGNLFTQTLDEILQSPLRIELMQKLASGNAPQFCIDNCLLY